MSGDNVYYNGTILCKKTNISDGDFAAVFQDTTAQAIINNRDGLYKMAIERFTIEGASLPIWIPSISSGNTTTYSITMTVDITGGVKPFVSDEIFLQFLPINNVPVGDPTYYYVYNYELFVDMMNNAFASCRSNLAGKILNYSLKTKTPMFTYDSDSNKFSIYVDSGGFIDNADGETCTIVFNNDLYTLLKTFYFKTLPSNYHQLIPRNRITNNVTIGGTLYYIISQMCPSTSNCWSPIQSIMFSSDSMTLIPEIVGNISVLSSSSAIGSGESNTKEAMITDFALDLTRSSDYFSEMITYTPTRLRYIDMSDADTIKNFRFNMFWINKYTGLKQPLLLNNFGSISIKVHFERK